ncbi:AP2-like ethylene-responsive transcription factor, partial [Nymphaea thermarum]
WHGVDALNGEPATVGKTEPEEFGAPRFISAGGSQREQQMPKLADFLGCGPTPSLSQTGGRGPELNAMYERGASFSFGEPELKMIAASGMQALPMGSMSEIDSVSCVRAKTRAGNFNGCSPDSGSDFYSSCFLGVGQGRGLLSQTESVASDGVEKSVVTIESAAPKKTIDTFGQRTSIYRGVTKHRWTGRYEAHLWDNSCKREGQARKGRQGESCSICLSFGLCLDGKEENRVKLGNLMVIGGYDKEEKAARAYDLAALKYWGPTATTNFPVSCYSKELEEMKDMTRQEFIAALRRKSSGFSRGASIYRGVTRHHQQGRWQARIGRVAGNKDLYLGTFSTEEEAAEAYDIAAIKFRGANAITNFEMSRYDVNAIMNSALPLAAASTTGAATLSSSSGNKRPKVSSSSTLTLGTDAFQGTDVVAVPHSLLCSPYAAGPATTTTTASLIDNFSPFQPAHHNQLFNPIFPSATDDASAVAAATIVHDSPLPAPDLCSRSYHIASYHQNPIFRQISGLDNNASWMTASTPTL